MNIIDLSLVGGVSARPNGLGSSNSASQGQSGDFGAILAGLAAQMQANPQAAGLIANMLQSAHAGAGSLIDPAILEVAGSGQDQGAEAPDVMGLFAQLGQKMLELATKLLNGEQTDTQKEELLPAIDDLIAGLSTQKGDGSGDVLVKLFVKAKEMLSNGGLDDLTDGLPAMLRLKIKLSVHNRGHALTGSEKEFAQYKLTANLLGIATPAAIEAGDGTGVSADKLALNIAEKLMAKFGFGHAASPLNGEAAINPPADTAIAQSVDEAMVAISNPEPKDKASASGETVVNLKADSAVEPKLHLVAGDNGAVVRNSLGRADDGLNGDSAKPEVYSLGKANNATDAGAAQHESPDLADGDSSGAAKATDTAPNTTYNFAIDGKGTFAGHIDRAMASSTSGQAIPAQPTHINPDYILGQIVEKFEVLMGEGRSEAKIALVPKHLGELKIHLVMENGTMKAMLDASSSHAKDILEANLPSLRQSLESQGLQVKEFSVSVGQHHSNQGHAFGRFNHGRFVGIHEPAVPAKEAPNVRAAFNAGRAMAVNYLA